MSRPRLGPRPRKWEEVWDFAGRRGERDKRKKRDKRDKRKKSLITPPLAPPLQRRGVRREVASLQRRGKRREVASLQRRGVLPTPVFPAPIRGGVRGGVDKLFFLFKIFIVEKI